MEHEDLFAKYGGTEAQLLTIDLMEGHDFEYWCAGLLRNIGFTHVEVTPGSNDQGVDILAQKDGVKYAIQCKRYSHDLGNTPVQEVHAGKSMYSCHVGVVLTNQHFTAGAKQLAQATGVLLWDRSWIERNLESVPNLTHEDTPSYSGDELFSQAVEIILDTCNASVSHLQRRFNIGYARAARIIEEMEARGIVGPFQGSKPRSILITKDQWAARISNNNFASPAADIDSAIDRPQSRPISEKSDGDRHTITIPTEMLMRAMEAAPTVTATKNHPSPSRITSSKNSVSRTPDIDPVPDYHPEDVMVELTELPRLSWFHSFKDSFGVFITKAKSIAQFLLRFLTFAFCWASCTLIIGIFATQISRAGWGMIGSIIYLLMVFPLPIYCSYLIIFKKLKNHRVYSKLWFWFLLFLFLGILVPMIIA